MVAAVSMLARTDYFAHLSPLLVGGWVSTWLLTPGLTRESCARAAQRS